MIGAELMVGPWAHEPYQLWSFWEMVPIQVDILMSLYDFMKPLVLLEHQPQFANEPIPEKLRDQFLFGTSRAVDYLRQIGLEDSSEQLRNLRETISDPETSYYAQVGGDAKVFLDRLERELGKYRYQAIPKSDTPFYLGATKHILGEQFEVKHPSLAKELNAAGRCFALDEHTSCVFHLFRGVEHGLHLFATSVGLTLRKSHGKNGPIIHPRNWDNLADNIRKKISATSPATVQEKSMKSDQLHALERFDGLRAKRNETCHPDKFYGRVEAQDFLNAVSGFIRELVKVI